MFKKLYTLTGALATAFYPGFAFSTCEFEERTDVVYQKEIQSIRDYSRHSISFVEGTRKCIVSMSVKIDDEWYIADGSYVFSSSMTEDAACSQADERAKQDILRVVSPENLTGSKNLVCNNKSSNPVDLLSDKRYDNKCTKVYLDAKINGRTEKVWGYNCHE